MNAWDPEVFCIDINTSQGSSKYFPHLETILLNLPKNTSQHKWIVIVYIRIVKWCKIRLKKHLNLDTLYKNQNAQ